MSSSNFFDGLLDENWEIATGAVVVVLAWIVGTRCFGGRSVVRQFPRTAACAELILAPLTVVVFGGVTRVLLEKFGITGLNDEIRFVVAVGVYLVIAWCVARIVELWILS